MQQLTGLCLMERVTAVVIRGSPIAVSLTYFYLSFKKKNVMTSLPVADHRNDVTPIR